MTRQLALAMVLAKCLTYDTVMPVTVWRQLPKRAREDWLRTAGQALEDLGHLGFEVTPQG